MKDIWIGKRIKIDYITSYNPCFDNCKPGTTHIVIEPPPGKLNGDGGVWIQGVGELVKILFCEFKQVPKIKRTRNVIKPKCKFTRNK